MIAGDEIMRQQEYHEIQDIKRDVSLFVVILVAIMCLMVISADAKINDCETIAQDYAEEFNMNIVWVQYLNSNGAYIFDGKNGAHILNSKVIKGKRYYFDFSIQSYASVIFNSKEEVSQFYKDKSGYDNEVYVIGIDNIPFSTYWDK